MLNDVLTETELNIIEPYFDELITGSRASLLKRDFCDMSQPYETPIDDFELVNAMLPSRCSPGLANNVFL